jgi:hypothetical protein
MCLPQNPEGPPEHIIGSVNLWQYSPAAQVSPPQAPGVPEGEGEGDGEGVGVGAGVGGAATVSPPKKQR